MFRRLLCILSLMALATAPSPAQEPRPVLVFAAASLQTAFNAIAAAWQQDSGGKVTFSYAASSALARQLEQGAPADLFATADLDWMDWAQQRNLIRPETRRTLLENTLVLIEPADRPPTSLKIGPGFALAEALGDGRLATGQVQSVPVGRYARQALTHLGLWEAIAPRIAGVENVRAALALVARGEARFGIVYATDAKAEPRVRVVDTFPADSHPPILYPLALTAQASHKQAKSFLDYLSSPAAIRIFEAEGFRVTR
ncbi:MAG: molybdate ABC transporter substrate-binding protein [Beijerinckiaceae bacterium]|nr:molybdate ABC transporter substrate-binding protein [Beijerinckiaceae bacterium]MCZ8301287.1 molybdate ABC transporter substrate-binding protein [Beijerinckiaceae bacterium]